MKMEEIVERLLATKTEYRFRGFYSLAGLDYADESESRETLINPDGPQAAAMLTDQAGRIERLVEALKPFAAIKPSTLHPADGSEAEEYSVILRGTWGNPAEFTGEDLRKARSALLSEERG